MFSTGISFTQYVFGLIILSLYTNFIYFYNFFVLFLFYLLFFFLFIFTVKNKRRITTHEDKGWGRIIGPLYIPSIFRSICDIDS